MRFVDLSVAGLIAFSGVVTLLIWNPQGPDLQASYNYDQARLRDSLVTVVQRVGVSRLTHMSISGLCGLLGSLSNSTMTFSASEGGTSCGTGPPPGAAQAQLTVFVGKNVVVLEAWAGAGG